MSHGPVLDLSDNLSGELVASVGHQVQNVNTGHSIDDRYRLGQQDTDRMPALRWMGPVAFARACGSVPGINHDLGTRWGPNCDQRVSLRVGVGLDAGVLYVHDPTWDEYAVLATDVTLAEVEDGCARIRRLGEEPTVEHLATVLPNVAVARPSRGPER